MLSKEGFVKDRAECADDIVVSGISGRFPNSRNMEEFSRNLYNKVQLVDDKETRWKHTNPEVPRTIGKLDGLEKFDATFFGIREKAAMATDPQGRILLEESYQVLLDAGINPKNFKGSRTGVFLGCGSSESEIFWFYHNDCPDGLALSGNSRSLLANRISFALHLTGPSVCVDTACSSSAYALDLAVNAIRVGKCDSAIVAGSNLLLNALTSLQFQRLGVVSPTGTCRPFDENANGYVRSETICVLLLQKRKDANRCYATLEHTLTNCDGHKPEGIHFPSGDIQMDLLKKFYSDIKMPPSAVDYVECHSTGTQVGDPQECRAVSEVFCPGRKEPLLIGSVKSNAGHAEAASSMTSIAKVMIAFENRKIPPNINFEKPKSSIPSLNDGRLKVVSEATDFKGSLISMNSYGFGGANSHTLFRIHSKDKKNHGIPEDKIPRLLVWSGRTEDSIEAIIDSVTKRPLDAEHIALLQNTQLNSLPFNIYKGYGIFTQNGESENAICSQRGVQHYNGEKRPMVWCYSGMGSQYCTMGKDLMKIPIFESAINKCHDVLATKGMDLKEILTSSDPKIFDNILHSFVGIAAIQIGITDILKALGLEPDYIIGHSVGELGCGYGDNCFSAEEMILAAYSRGMASIQTKVIFGSMAAIGLGYEQLKDMIPKGIEIACHNSFESSTISGPAEIISKFVAELKAKGIFAKEVACSNIPYHSSYIKEMGPKLLKNLREIMKHPVKRSEKWISSSVPQHLWNSESCQYSSAEYHTNNLLSPVLFEESAKTLPENSIIIEIAPHGLLQAILKRSHKDAVYIPLTQRGNNSQEQFLLGALGKIYMNGFDLNLPLIYPAVKFPVSRGTQMISPYIKWDHTEDYTVSTTLNESSEKSAERVITISLNDSLFEFIEGHCIDGRILFPATGYLFLAWETFVFIKNLSLNAQPVEFEDIKFLRATTITKDAKIKLVVVIQPGTGRFEISEGTETCVTGCIKLLEKVQLTNIEAKRDDKNILPTPDFYKELRLRGYHYKNLFKSVKEANYDGLYGKVNWHGNWVAFLDNMLQIQILSKDSRSLVLPTGFQRITICPQTQFEIINEQKENEEVFLEAFASRELNMVRCGGVELVNLKSSTVQRRRPPGVPVLESYQFIPYNMSPIVDEIDAARIIMQLALENVPTSKVKGVEVGGKMKKTFLPYIRDTLFDLPLITHDLTYLTPEACEEEQQIKFENCKLSSIKDCYMVMTPNDPELIEESCKSLMDKGFLIVRQNTSTISELNPKFKKFAVARTESEFFILYQYRMQDEEKTLTALKISEKDETFEWLEKAKELLNTSPLVLFAENEPNNGLIGLVNCLRREPIKYSLQCVFIDDKKAPKFDLNNEFYSKQLKLDLGVNIFRDGQWGCYRHLLIKQNLKEQATRNPCYVNALIKSDLSSLKWLSSPICSENQNENFTKVQVHYASLNFKDVMLATGRISADLFVESRMEHECILGIEYSGINENKKRVMGIAVSGALSTNLSVDKRLMWNCPDSWSLSEAATVPCVYGTVYYAFFMTTHIESGKSILIHAGTGGIGLAAIRVAFAYGLEVFTTVSTDDKKNYLLKEFPQLKAENIGNSRSTSFEKMIMRRTNGKGVDYVLNSLAEEKLLASIRCLGHLGKFLEIGKFDMERDTKIGMSCFLKELSFHSVMLDKLFSGPDSMKMRLGKMIDNDIKSGVIKPLKTNIFPASQVEQAFRLLASGRHMGKVIVQVREKESDQMTLPIVVLPRVYCHPEYSYIIPGGLGGFGLELADWLVMRGCRKIVLSSSRGITKQYQAYRIKIWESYGVKIAVDTSDITTKSGCEQLIRKAMMMGPVGGIFNLAVLLRDSIFENQDTTKFKESMAPKAYATKYLDELSRVLCPHLEYFVIFSSVSCGRGNPGQSNYGMANSVMERIMEQRKKVGLPAKAIQWGAVGEVGIVADMQEESNIDMEIGGTLQQRISSCLEELDNLILTNEPLVSSMVVAEKKVVGGSKGNILETIIAIMGIRDMKSISLDTTLSELGMDSLMAVELKQLLERDFDINLSMQELRALNFRKIIEYSKAKPGQEVEKSEAKEEENVNNVFADIMKNFGILVINDKVIQELNLKHSSKRLAIIIPGMQGNASKHMLALCGQLKFAYCLVQYNKKEACYSRSVEAIVNIIKDDIEKVLQGYEEYHLIGHSFGGLIAINLASVLEKKGRRGRVTIIDASPEMFGAIAEKQTKGKTEEEFQNFVLAYMISLFYQNVDRSKFSFLFETKTWEEKCNKTLDLVLELGYQYSREDLKHCLNACYSRALIMTTVSKEPLGYLKNSKCLFVKPTEVTLEHENEAYDLKNFFEQNLDVVQLEGNHQTIISSPQMVELLNEIHDKI